MAKYIMEIIRNYVWLYSKCKASHQFLQIHFSKLQIIIVFISYPLKTLIWWILGCNFKINATHGKSAFDVCCTWYDQCWNTLICSIVHSFYRESGCVHCKPCSAGTEARSTGMTNCTECEKGISHLSMRKTYIGISVLSTHLLSTPIIVAT